MSVTSRQLSKNPRIWIAVTSNEVYGLLWSKWPVDHPWSWMTNVRAFTSVPASRETRHRSVSQQDLLRSGGAQGGRIFWDHKEVFLHIGRGSRSWMTKRWRPHSSSSLQRNKTFFLSIKNCYLFLHRICWDQEEAKGTRSVEIRNWGRWRSRGCRGIFHSVLKIMIMGIWFTYNTIKLCKFLFLSFKTVVPPKSRGDFPNLEILRFFWITLYAGVSNI